MFRINKSGSASGLLRLGHYVQGILVPAGRNLVVVSGQLPMLPDGTMPSGTTITEDTLLALVNVEQVLADKGAKIEDIFLVFVALRNIEDAPKFDAKYAEFFGDHKPCRFTMEASGLAKGARIEIMAVAAV